MISEKMKANTHWSGVIQRLEDGVYEVIRHTAVGQNP